jgi:hypothetical protein
MNRAGIPVISITARVMVAGVGHPVGVFGRMGIEVISPLVISSASRIGVRSVLSGAGPAADTPGTVDRRVFPRILQKTGSLVEISGTGSANGMFHHCLFSRCIKVSLPGGIRREPLNSKG